MNRIWRITWSFVIVACIARPLLAQTPRTNDAPAQFQFAKSPVESFRELLVAPTVEREKLLVVYPPEIRTRIQEKIAEYQSLKPEEQKLRLLVTELRWYLLPLLSLPATNRAAHMAVIPPAMRELIEPRLQRWSILPPPLRQMLLTNEQAVEYLIRVDRPPDQLPALTGEQRRKVSDYFNKLVELTPEEQKKVLGTLSAAEQRQMEKTLQAFEKLPQSQRARCIKSFAKFASLSAAEQQDFLKNAERWSQMSESEREAWRELVSIAPILPPLPPLPRPKEAPLTVGFPAPGTTKRK